MTDILHREIKMARKAEKVCREARIIAERWFSEWHQNTLNYHEMTSFIFGEQWKDDEEDILKSYKKVPMQVNKLGTLSNILCGEQQRNTPQLQVLPLSDCDQETASLRETIVKDIMFRTDAKDCYQVVAKQAFEGGFSAYAVLPKYLCEDTFDTELAYYSFKDPTKCYFSIDAESGNKTDSMHSGWITHISRAKFADMFGKNIEEKIVDEKSEIAATKEEVAMVTAVNATESITWSDENTVTIQNHFLRKSTKEMRYKLSNGHILDQNEMDELIKASEQRREDQMIQMRMQRVMQQQQAQAQMQQSPQQMQDPNMPQGQYDPLIGQQQPLMAAQDQDTSQEMSPDEQDLMQQPLALYDEDELVRIEDKKEVKKYVIKWQIICGQYLLDETEIPLSQSPLIFVDQNSIYTKKGKQLTKSFFQDVKDTQRYINYLATQSAYVLKVSRYDQWIGSVKNVSSNDTQQKWRDPLIIQGMLPFDESPSGVVPQRVAAPELSQSLLTQYQRAIEDLYTSTGLYPSRMGQQGNEISGDAIDSRARQGSYSTECAFNSINKAIAKGGEIVNELIPYIYDTARVIGLMTPDEGYKTIMINQQEDEYGERIKNDIRKGSYQVKLIAGPSYEGQKEQAMASFNAAISAYPNIFPMIADLYAENLPLANTIEIKNRLKTLVPPEIIEAGKTGKPLQQQQQDPAAIQAQQQAQFQDEQLKLKQEEIEIKKQELQLKAQKQTHDIQLELARLESERQEIAGQIEEKKLQFISENNRSQQDLAIAHANNMAKILTSHKPNLQQQRV